MTPVGKVCDIVAGTAHQATAEILVEQQRSLHAWRTLDRLQLLKQHQQH
jgi:hypothetical protein